MSEAAAEDILNNLADYDVVEEIDPEALSTDQQPPPPEGRYRVRLRPARDAEKDQAKLAKVAAKFGAGRFPANNVTFFVGKPGSQYAGQMVWSMFIEHELILEDGTKAPGRAVQQYVSSVKFGKNTSRIDDYLRALTGQAGVGMTPAQKVQAVYDAISGEPLIYAEIRWEGQSLKVDADGNVVTRANGKNDYDTAVVGGKKLTRMANFPFFEDAQGVRHYKVPDEDDNGNTVNVGWVPDALLPLK